MMKPIRLAAAMAWVATAALGFGPPQQRDGLGEQLGKLFGKNLSFTAVAQMTVADAKGKQLHMLEMDYAVRDGNLRTEMDLARMAAGADMPAEAAAHMKAMGMDKTVTIARPAERLTFIVYPGMKAYCAMTAPADAPNPDNPPKIERESLGKETVDGHPCVKERVTITDADGKKQDMLVWTATDLKQFPIKTQMAVEQQTMTMLFQKIKLEAPPAELFAEPKEFKKYGNMQELMMSGMHRMMPKGHPPIPADEP
jgi:hypothetical protein